MSSDPPLSSANAIVHGYHQRTKHRFEAYAAGPEALDWDDQPAAFRHFDGAPQFALPRLSAVAPGSALQSALQRPFSSLAQFADPPLLSFSLTAIAAWLQLSLGITAWKSFGPDRWAVRANPSSGNLHPTEAYLLLSNIPGLSDGLYHYRPENHALELRASHAQGASGGQPQLGILLTSVMWREAWKYGERAFRYCQLDTGHAVAALRYGAAVLGWSLAEQTEIGHTTMARLAGVDRAADFPARRHAETELEEAESLKVGAGGTAHPWTVAGLDALAAAACWHGVASTVDRHPFYRWPLIAEVAVATRQNEARPASPALLSLPAVSSRPDPASLAAADLLLRRRSAQRFDGRHVMDVDRFAALVARLHPAACLPWDALVATPRAALVFFVHRVAGLTPGLYLLPRTERLFSALRPHLSRRFEFAPVPGVERLLQLVAMVPMSAMELQRTARSLHCHQDIAANSCLALGMLTEFDAALDDGPAAYRRLYRECGLIGQVLYLEAEAQGLRGTGIGCFFDDPVHGLLGLDALDGSAWQTLYHFTVGLPIEDSRIETTAAYADDLPSSPMEGL